MKRLFSLIVLIAISATFIYSQERNDDIDSVSVVSDTSYSEIEYGFTYSGVVKYDGVAGYQFTVSEDTLTKISLEGSYDGVNYINIVDSTTITAGNYVLYDINPEFLKYRLGIYGGSSDTLTVKNIVYFVKETK